MSYELLVLGLSGLLLGLQIGLYSTCANRELGPKYLAGPRDGGVAFTGVAGRLQRALGNQLEGLVLFAVAVLLLELGGGGSRLTEVCAGLYLLARLLYVPAYAFGWAPWRSLIWAVGFLATLVMLMAGLAPALGA
jgi:uncharacterized MAPEG superfamily protein